MTARIPVYRREIAPGIGFMTFEDKGTTLLGWIGSDREVWIHLDALQMRTPLGGYVDEFWPEVAVAYARVGIAGLKFEGVTIEYTPDQLQALRKKAMEEAVNAVMGSSWTHALDDRASPATILDWDSPIAVNPESVEKTWRDRAIEKPLL